MHVHVTDDRFDRELRRRQLARRLVAHQARTQTVSELTSLTRHQLATLRRRWRVMQETRHRGPSPKSFAVFFSSARVRSEAGALATLCRLLDAVPAAGRASAQKKLSGVEIGERLCDVFEVYSARLSRVAFEFEHLVLLARGLAKGDAIAIGNCSNCQSSILIDLFATRRHICSHCAQEAEGSSARKDEVDEGVENDRADDEETYSVQTELF